MLYPLTFHPIFKERVWGGRRLEQLYGKHLPAGKSIGESWEISDRPGDVSVISNGPLAGKDLHWLMQNHPQEVLGNVPSQNGRFPLLIKILDARQKLSLQVHPPAHKATALGGESKTELWYIAEAAPGAELFVGLRRGVTRQEFEQKIEAGAVAECFHRVKVKQGDAMFLPSGRVHALGDGLVIFEIQQNSDTTYRVFDWNRVGLDGKPRELHVKESLESIDFDDFEPGLAGNESREMTGATHRTLLKHDLFSAHIRDYSKHASLPFGPAGKSFLILGVLQGKLIAGRNTQEITVRAGEFCLIPAASEEGRAVIEPGSSVLFVSAVE